MPLCCPLCSASLSASALEAHLRYELRLPLLACLLCERSFCDEAAARAHFRGPLARHTGPAQLVEPPAQREKTQRLLELMRMARGGKEAVERRLCLCGQCRLVCREEGDGERTGAGARQSSETPEESAPQYQNPFEIPVGLTEPPQLAETLTTLSEEHKTENSEPAAYLDPDEAQENIGQGTKSAACPEPNEAEEMEEEERETPSTPLGDAPDTSLWHNMTPQAERDDRAACSQCHRRISRSNYNNHASWHMTTRPFQCLLCPRSEKLKGEMARHLRKEHGTGLGASTFTGAVSKEEVRRLVDLCFGDATKAAYAKALCRECRLPIVRGLIRRHVATVHLKKPLHECRRCDYAVTEPNASSMRSHVAKYHKADPGPDTIDSFGMRHYLPDIQAMAKDLFDL